MSHPLVLPVLIQTALALCLLLTLAPRRVSAVKKAGGVKALAKAGGFNESLKNHANNYNHQFELPVVFYALCLVFIATGTVSQTVVIAAWVFVASRIVHTFVQVTKNIIFPYRFLSFLVGALALIVMLAVAITKAV